MADKFVNENNAKTMLNKVKTYTDQGLANKQDNLTFDTTPTADSANPVTSGGVKTYVDDRFDGASKAISYADYSTMITAFNALADDVYGIGQDIYIVTTEVPDLWVSSVESTSVQYTYVDDATFTNALKTNGYVQVGYYRLSALETGKVDLTGYLSLDTTEQTFSGDKTLKANYIKIKSNTSFTGNAYINLRGDSPRIEIMYNDNSGVKINNLGTSVIKNGVLKEITFPHKSGTFALIQDIFPAFSTSSTYAVGDLVTYSGAFYRCTIAVTVAGAWDANNWTATTLEAELKSKQSTMSAMTNAEIDTIMDAILV